MKDANKPCPCGSGKKVKHCHRGAHNPITAVEFSFDPIKGVKGVTLSEDGRVRIHHSDGVTTPHYAELTRFRQKLGIKKGERDLFRVPMRQPKIDLNEYKIFEDSDYVFAIDCSHNSQKNHSFAAVMLVEQKVEEEKIRVEWNLIGGFEFYGVSENYEHFSWYLLIRYLIDSGIDKKINKIFIITDADSSKHQEFNLRKSPIYNEFFIPENYKIIYAFDRGESCFNKVMNSCDRLSKVIRSKIERGELTNSALRPTDGIAIRILGIK